MLHWLWFTIFIGGAAVAQTLTPTSAKLLDAGPVLRRSMLEKSAKAFGIAPTKEFPRVYGIVADACTDWRTDVETTSMLLLANGDAGAYVAPAQHDAGTQIKASPSTKASPRSLASAEQARIRAVVGRFFHAAEQKFDQSARATNFSRPKQGWARIYLIGFDDVRMIEIDQAETWNGIGVYDSLFRCAFELSGELELASLRVFGDPGDDKIRVAVSGEVEHEGVYWLPKKTSIGEAGKAAGGIRPAHWWAMSYIERLTDGNDETIRFKDKSKEQFFETPLRDNDRLHFGREYL